MPNPDGSLTDEERAAAAGSPVPAPFAIPHDDFRAGVIPLAEQQRMAAEARAQRGGPLGEDRVRNLLQQAAGELGAGDSDDGNPLPKRGDAGGLSDKTTAGLDSVLGKGASGSRVVSLAPNWYKPEAPVHPSFGQKAGNLLADTLAGGAQRNADMSASMQGRPLYLKQQDQGRANATGLLAGLGKALLNGSQDDQKQDLDTALKQAQLQHAIAGSRSTAAGGGPLDLLKVNAQYGNLGMRSLGTADTINRLNTAQRERANMQDPNSAVSQESTRAHAAAADATGVPDDMIGKLSQRDVEKIQPTLRQNKQQQFQDTQLGKRSTIASTQDAKERNDAQAAVIAKEERERDESISQLARDDGEFRAGSNPNPVQVKKVDELRDARQSMLTGLQRLQEISQQFIDKYGDGALDNLRVTIAQKGINFDRDDAALISEAERLKGTLKASQRLAENMGAPQAFEDQLTAKSNDANATLSGILFPLEFYQGTINGVNQGTATALRNNGFQLQGTAPLKAVEQPARKSYQAQPLDFTGGPAYGRPFSVPPVPQVNEKLPTTGGVPPIPADARKPSKAQQLPDKTATAPTAATKYNVVKSDGTVVGSYTMTPEQAAQASEGAKSKGLQLVEAK